MVKEDYKGRCEKKILVKCLEVCRCYNQIQSMYGNKLEADNDIIAVECNVRSFCFGDEHKQYTTDFLCKKSDGTQMVRECVFRKHLTKPMTAKLLDASREYWINHGVSDWGIVVNAE